MTFGNRTLQDSAVAIEAIQATFIISKAQIWNGSSAARRRIRLSRYGEIITAARTMCLMNTSTTSVYQSLVSKNFDWADFVNKETRVRLMSYIFVVDTEFAMFHNLPPRVAIAELNLDILSSEHCFSATTADSCWGALQADTAYRPKGLAALIAKFLGKYWDDASCQEAEALSILSLFIVILALHQVLWLSKHSALGQESAAPMRRALSRWKDAWDVQRSRTTTEEWQALGFMRNAPEFWWLARVLNEMDVKIERETDSKFAQEAAFSEENVVHLDKLFASMQKLNL